MKVSDDPMLIYFRLCKAGFARSISEAREMDCRTVLQALAYEKFLGDYELAYLELNKE